MTRHEKEDIRKLANKTEGVETDVNQFEVAEASQKAEEGR